MIDGVGSLLGELEFDLGGCGRGRVGAEAKEGVGDKGRLEWIQSVDNFECS